MHGMPGAAAATSTAYVPVVEGESDYDEALARKCEGVARLFADFPGIPQLQARRSLRA